MPERSVHISLVLDLTRGVRGYRDSVEACRALAVSDWNLTVGYADVDGQRAADEAASADPRAQALRLGSGTGDCDWAAAIRQARGTSIVFLRPGDRLRPDALTRLASAGTHADPADWVLGAVEGAPHAWWHQPTLPGSAAALLLAGAAFPECGALVSRDAWLRVVEAFPATTRDASRATAWLALAMTVSPRLLPDVVASTSTVPSQVEPELLVEVLEEAGARRPPDVARLTSDLSRLASGLRVGWHVFERALEASWHVLGEPSSIAAPDVWEHRWTFLLRMLARADRPIWIWGAGQLGLEALDWLRVHGVPVQGFLDGDASRDGQVWGGLPVKHGGMIAAPGTEADRPLVVIASMYHAAIVENLHSCGFTLGRDALVFDRRLPRQDVSGTA